MENNFNNNEFEEFLHNQLRNHRMYPVDNVWRNIHKKLHGDTRWPALTIGALAILSVTVFICFYFSPSPDLFNVKPITAAILSKSNAAQINPANTLPPNTNIGISSIQNYSTASFTKNNNAIIEAGIHNIGNDLQSNEIDPFFSNDENVSQKTISKSTISISNIQSPISFSTFSGSKIPFLKSPLSLLQSGMLNKKLVEPSEKILAEADTKKQLSLIEKYKVSRSKKSKWSLQVYVAPSISYRQMYEDGSLQKENVDGPIALNYVADVNNIVRHKPGTGIEAGLSFQYAIAKKLRFKLGLQFNIRQYSIEAYRSSSEIADIALSNGNQLDTISTIAIYRTNNGLYSTKLLNRYYQICIPIGLEYQILGNTKIQWNIAGSLQPTYLVNRNAYMISTNFKNYTESPEMVRRWNLNSTLETFVSFKSGGLKWQVGPQVRYQPYSTFIRQYSIKEHLLDYGVKVGVSTGL